MVGFHNVASSLLLATTVVGGQIEIDVTNYNVKGDGKSDDTAGIQAAFDDASLKVKSSNGQGVHVKFPKKEYVFGAVHFEGLDNSLISFASGTTLNTLCKIDNNCDQNWDSGTGSGRRRRKGLSQEQNSGHPDPWIKGESSTGLTIDGGGPATIFDGNGVWWGNTDKKIAHKKPRPRMMSFGKMTHFKLLNMHLHDAPTGHMTIKGSQHVEVHKLRLDTDVDTANTDGLGFGDCTDVWAHELYVKNGDDSIQTANSRDVTIEHGEIIGGHGLNMGGDRGDISNYNITFQHMTLTNMHRGTRIKITRDTTGSLEKILYKNISMIDVKIPMGIQTDYGEGYQTGHSGLAASGPGFTFKDISWEGITARESKGVPGHSAHGSGGSIVTPGEFKCSHASSDGCKELYFKDIDIQGHEMGAWVCEDCKCTGDDGLCTKKGPSPSPDDGGRRRRKTPPSPTPTPTPPTPTPPKPDDGGRRRRKTPTPPPPTPKPDDGGRRRRKTPTPPPPTPHDGSRRRRRKSQIADIMV